MAIPKRSSATVMLERYSVSTGCLSNQAMTPEYGFCEGYLDGNTEILFLEDQFAVVCYHAKLSSYPVTLPIGFMTTNIRQVNHIISLAKNYLSSPLFPNKNEDEIGQKDFGLLKP